MPTTAPAPRLRRLLDAAGSTPWLPVVVATAAGLLAGRLIALDPLLIVLAIGAFVAVATTVRLPHWALAGVLALLLVEGALRKWLLPQLQEWIYFAKDGVLLLLVVMWLLEGGRRRHDAPVAPLSDAVRTLAAVFALYMVLQLLNPRNPSLTLYVFGLRTYFLPLALIVVVPWLWPRGTAERAMTAVVAAVLPLTLLAVVQSQLDAGHWLNTYVSGDQSVATMGLGDQAVVRATGTFSYISGFTGYLTVAILAAPGLLSWTGRAGWGLPAVAVVAGVVAVITTGSRAPLAFAVAGVPVVTYPLWGRQGPRISFRGVVAATVAATVALHFLGNSLEQYTERARTASDTQQRIVDIFEGPLVGASVGGVFGWGPGTTHQSRGMLLARVGEWGALPSTPEVETGRVIVELGVLGGVLWYAFRLALVVMLAGWAIRARERMAPAAQMFLLGAFVVGVFGLVDTLILNVYLYYLWAFWVGCARLYVGEAAGVGAAANDRRAIASAASDNSAAAP